MEHSIPRCAVTGINQPAPTAATTPSLCARHIVGTQHQIRKDTEIRQRWLKAGELDVLYPSALQSGESHIIGRDNQDVHDIADREGTHLVAFSRCQRLGIVGDVYLVGFLCLIAS